MCESTKKCIYSWGLPCFSPCDICFHEEGRCPYLLLPALPCVCVRHSGTCLWPSPPTYARLSPYWFLKWQLLPRFYGRALSKLTTYLHKTQLEHGSQYPYFNWEGLVYLFEYCVLSDPPPVGQTGQSLFCVKSCLDSKHKIRQEVILTCVTKQRQLSLSSSKNLRELLIPQWPPGDPPQHRN